MRLLFKEDSHNLITGSARNVVIQNTLIKARLISFLNVDSCNFFVTLQHDEAEFENSIEVRNLH